MAFDDFVHRRATTATRCFSLIQRSHRKASPRRTFFQPESAQSSPSASIYTGRLGTSIYCIYCRIIGTIQRGTSIRRYFSGRINGQHLAPETRAPERSRAQSGIPLRRERSSILRFVFGVLSSRAPKSSISRKQERHLQRLQLARTFSITIGLHETWPSC